jgi:Asp-tRNA(Asn)/Glu-tRNA(Gln) amidotransferase A subunit family amidase
VTCHPAVSVPAGFTVGGLPVGLQLAGRYETDDRLALTQAGSWCVSPQRFTVALPAKLPNSM